MNDLTKEEYYQWVEENESYPKHSHQWIVRTYTDTSDFNPNELFYRNFGPFETQGKAKSWIDNYKRQYTKPGFISKISIEAICEALLMTEEQKEKEERRKEYESMKKEIEGEMERLYSWAINDYNEIWIKRYRELKEEFEND